MAKILTDIPDESATDIGDSVYDQYILVVDDSPTCREMMKASFLRAGFSHVLQAKDGEEALELTYKYSPAIVILDLYMPVIDGVEYCKRIRQDNNFNYMPIIIQSSTTEAYDIHDAFTAGANDFISKPPSSDELVSRAMVHIRGVLMQRSLSVYKKRMESDLDIARRMQMSIMPDSEEIERYVKEYQCKIAALFEPSDELGGDFWGMRRINETKMAVYNIDFSGHGVAAALNTFRLHAILHEDRGNFYDAGQCMTDINSYLCPLLDVGQYATVFYGVIDTEADTISYVLTGAPSPLIITKEGKAKKLEGRGVPVGALKNMAYEEITHPFYPGETLVTYSDALIETASPEGNFFSEEDISQCIALLLQSGDAQEKLRVLVDRFHAFIGQGKFVEDDLTIVIYQRDGG